ncbi:hypothetical protein V5799_031917 [Amblyomma americanum]|uniref:Uncharacterized protein n=1 Tax=Amblyomma americanum TaxID=6943 RepID=A0AAQ4DSN4_AMBAM
MSDEDGISTTWERRRPSKRRKRTREDRSTSSIEKTFVFRYSFVCFCRPQITSRSNNTTESEISLESCNQTCNSSNNETCCEGCTCFLINNDTQGHCYKIVGLDYEYGSLNMSSLDAYTPIPARTNPEE